LPARSLGAAERAIVVRNGKASVGLPSRAPEHHFTGAGRQSIPPAAATAVVIFRPLLTLITNPPGTTVRIISPINTLHRHSGWPADGALFAVTADDPGPKSSNIRGLTSQR